MSAASQLLTRAGSLARRACANRVTRTSIFVALALLAKWPLLSTAGALVDFRDAQYFTLFEESARLTVARFHEAPLWNPYYCGGIPALAIPSARFVSPTFLLTLLFGTLRADALIAFFMTVVGLEGAFVYARARGASSAGAVLAAPVFALSGLFAAASPLGWTNFFGFEIVPWVAYGARRALGGSVRGALIAAVGFGWIVGHGGTYATPLAALLCIVEGIETLAVRARRRQPIGPALGMAAIVGLLALGLAAVRLWPIAELLRRSPRVLGGWPGNDLPTLASVLLGGRSLAELGRGSFLVGAFAVPVALIGVFFSPLRRALPRLGAAALWLWLAAGYTAAVSAFAILRTVPPFTMLRYPERFLVLFALALATLAALGVTRLELAARRRRWARFALGGAVLLLAANTGLLVHNDYAEAEGRMLLPAPAPEGEARDFKQARGNRWVAAEYSAMGRGSLSCFDDYQVPQSRLLRGDLAEEEYLNDPSAGEVTRRRWSPDRIDLRVRLARPATLYVNQNWHPGWRASAGEVRQEEGLLAVDLPPGERDLSLHFAPRSGVGGAAVSLVALLAAAALGWRAWRTRKDDSIHGVLAFTESIVLAAAPVLVGIGILLTVREPPMPAPTLVAPSGEPIVADAPPANAHKLGARLAGGVTLEASRLAVQTVGRDERAVTLELDWRLASKARAGMGVFVHIEGPTGDDNVNVDHALVSSVVPFEDSPVGVTLRDISSPIALPDKAGPRRWKVYAGLWMARRGGERVPVVSAEGTTISEDRVLVGEFQTL
jgi:hypothetical protein